MLNNTALVIEIITGIIFIIGTIISCSIFLIRKTKITKIKKLYFLIQDWFDEIDINLNKNLSFDLLNNKENKIRQFIEDNKLKNTRLKISKKIRSKFLKYCGIKEELLDNIELFKKYSRSNSDFLYIDEFFYSLIGAFLKFHNNYKNAKPETNFADIEMKIKFFKMLIGLKIT